MAFTYSGDPSKSSLDLVRFYIGDTNSTAPILQDEEINYLISLSKNANKWIALAARQAATALHSRAVKRTLGPQSEDPTQRSKYYQALAEKYEKLSNYTGTPPLPEYDADLVFTKGMMTNET